MPHTYRVIARRTGASWVLHVLSPAGTVGTTSTRSLATAEKDARAHIAAVTDHRGDDVIVQLQPKLELQLGEMVQDARNASARLTELMAEVGAKSRAVAAHLRDAGLSNADIAVVLGVSEQRVSQLFGKTGKKD
jgi:predicted XRE-type DNA-binding protein